MKWIYVQIIVGEGDYKDTRQKDSQPGKGHSPKETERKKRSATVFEIE